MRIAHLPATRLKLLKVNASQFSGSTVLAFLLNTHPEIFTVSEMDGHTYGAAGFRCSCGEQVSECRFFRFVQDAFRERGLPFEFREFGTGYHLVTDRRVNRYLTGGLGRVSITPVERLRDTLVRHLPPFGRRVARSDQANLAFVQAGLAYNGARVFVDACKTPFRLRLLRRIPELDVLPLHLVRDPRGVALSNMTKRGWRASEAVRHWIRQQEDILRISGESPRRHTIYYEELCTAVDATLSATYRFVGVPPHPAPADFRSVEHHILGNRMRLGTLGTIEADTRWRRELSASDLDTISRTAFAFVERNPAHPLSEIVTHYLEPA